jgi:hypothetical protein
MSDWMTGCWSFFSTKSEQPTSAWRRNPVGIFDLLPARRFGSWAIDCAMGEVFMPNCTRCIAAERSLIILPVIDIRHKQWYDVPHSLVGKQVCQHF